MRRQVRGTKHDPKNIILFEKLGEQVKRQRELLSLSQQQLANLADVSVNLVRQFEGGKPTVHLTKVLDILTAAGLQFEVRPGHRRLVFPET